MHDEIVIYCFNQRYEKEWEFSARDIWVTQDNSEAILLFDEFIEMMEVKKNA